MIKKLTNTEEAVLDHFFRNPDTEIHIRGLADETDIPYSSVRNAVIELETQGLVRKRAESKMTFFSGNRRSDSFKQRKRRSNLRQLAESGVIDEIEDRFRPDAIVLFGSYLAGTDRSDSDIDIAVINGRTIEIDLSEYEDTLGRSIQLVEIPDSREESDEFRNTLANGYVLRGYLTVV